MPGCSAHVRASGEATRATGLNYNSHEAALHGVSGRSERRQHHPSRPSGDCSSPQRGAAWGKRHLGRLRERLSLQPASREGLRTLQAWLGLPSLQQRSLPASLLLQLHHDRSLCPQRFEMVCMRGLKCTLILTHNCWQQVLNFLAPLENGRNEISAWESFPEVTTSSHLLLG